MSRFDLEQRIMDCWGLVDDLRHVEAAISELTELQRRCVLLGLVELYEIKFRQTMDVLEECIYNGQM